MDEADAAGRRRTLAPFEGDTGVARFAAGREPPRFGGSRGAMLPFTMSSKFSLHQFANNCSALLKSLKIFCTLPALAYLRTDEVEDQRPRAMISMSGRRFARWSSEAPPCRSWYWHAPFTPRASDTCRHRRSSCFWSLGKRNSFAAFEPRKRLSTSPSQGGCRG